MLQKLITGTVGPVSIYKNRPALIQSTVDWMWFRIQRSVLALVLHCVHIAFCPTQSYASETCNINRNGHNRTLLTELSHHCMTIAQAQKKNQNTVYENCNNVTTAFTKGKKPMIPNLFTFLFNFMNR